MAVGWRWVLGCALGCALWSLPGWFALGGFLVSGVPLWLLLRPVVGPSAQRFAETMPLYAAVAIPAGVLVGFLCAIPSAYLFGGASAAFFLVPACGCGAALGALHAHMVWDRWGWWLVAGAVAGPTVLLVPVGWSTGLPLGAVPGAVYGLATSVQASRAIGRARGLRP